jgi:hypothetical protein
MVELDGVDSAKYPSTSVSERTAIDTFTYIVSHRNVVPQIWSMNITPNYDGYLEITEDDGKSIGHFMIQIRKSPDDSSEDPRLSCSLGFLKFCEEASLPVLLVAVDICHSLAYWILIDQNQIRRLAIKEAASSITVHFPIENKISRENVEYLEKWREILRHHHVRIKEFDILSDRHAKLALAYEVLSKTNEALGAERAEFERLHVFLDELNSLLDTDFLTIKRVLYGSCWKLGIAYGRYSDKEITYALYPIESAKNDLQIKYMTEEIRETLLQQGSKVVSHIDRNPLLTNPKVYAKKVISEDVEEMIRQMVLPVDNLVLSREILFSFVDAFHDCLGLDIKNEYDVAELINAFYVYLPIWIEESLNFKSLIVGAQGYIDPSLLISQLDNHDLDEIAERVRRRQESENKETRSVVVGSSKYPLRIIADLLNRLRSKGISRIDRLYIQPDFTKLVRANYVWSYYTREALLQNVETFFGALPGVYDSIIDTYFPRLKTELSFFKGFNGLRIFLDVKEDFDIIGNPPVIRYFDLLDMAEDKEKVKVYLATDETPMPEPDWVHGEVRIDSMTYKIGLRGDRVLDFIFETIPLFQYAYNLLLRRFKAYFEPNLRDVSFLAI